MRFFSVLVLALTTMSAPSSAQPPVAPAGGNATRPVNPGADAAREVLPDSVLQSSLRVFLDCQGGVRGCDRNFFVQEMGFVNWVRDRMDSDVHLLLTTLNAGNGGRQITVNFLGQKS